MTEFSDLLVGEQFAFPGKDKVYTKEEEQRRPYTPEAFSNASFLWENIGEMDNLISAGQTFFYATPSTKIIRV